VYQQMDLAEDLRNLSRVYRHEHRHDEALDTIKRSEVIDARVTKPRMVMLPDQPPLWHWYDQSERAEIFRERGDNAAAEPLFEQSLEMVGKIPLWEGPPRIAEMISDYATLLRDEGKFDEAESIYKHSLDSWAMNRARNVDPDQLEDADILTNYAELLRKLDRPAEAEPLEAQASAIRTKITALPEAASPASPN
jgi:tetratricopeptide (TPR) repeat protein